MLNRLSLFLLLSTCLVVTAVGQPMSNYWIRHFDRTRGDIHENVYSIAQDEVGLIWLSTYGGLYSYDGQEFMSHKGHTIAPPVPGYHWRPGTDTEQEAYLYLQNEVSQNNLRVLCSYTDKADNLWIGTSKGLWLFQKKGHLYGHVDMSEEVLCLFSDSFGNIWTTTRSGIVCLLDRELQPISYLTKTGDWDRKKQSSGFVVMDILESDDHNFWLSARKEGMVRMTMRGRDVRDGFDISVYRDKGNTNGGLSTLMNAYSARFDSQNRLWVASLESGLALIDNPLAPHLQAINVNGMLREAGQPQMPERTRSFLPVFKDSWLVATDDGLYSFSPLTWESGQVGSFVQIHQGTDTRKTVLSLLNDHDGLIYCGHSGEGLSVYTNFTEQGDIDYLGSITKAANNLPTDVVCSLVEDRHNRVWGFCDKGLFRLSIDRLGFLQNKIGAICVNVLNPDLFGSNMNMSIGNPMLLPDGRLLKGTLSGILWLQSDSIGIRQTDCPIYTRVTYKIADKDTTIVPTDTLFLPQKAKNLSFYLSVLDFSRESSVNYAYRCKSIDTTWTYISNHSFEINNFPLGYTEVEIRATNGDGNWGHKSRRILVYTPEGTPWAISLFCVLGLSAICYLILLARRVKSKSTFENDLAIQSILLGLPDKDDVNQKHRDEMRNVIIVHLEDPEFGLSQFASSMKMSRSVLQNRVKELFGITPIELIILVRVQAATELLSKTELSISEISYKVGFNDPKYFSRVYKKKTGLSPSSRRNQTLSY